MELKQSYIITQKELQTRNNGRVIFTEFNKVIVRGKIEAEVEYNHTIFSESFYKTRVISERKSGTIDYVPVIISEVLLGEKIGNLKGRRVEVSGQLRTHNLHPIGNRSSSRLEIFLFVTDIVFIDDECDLKDENVVYLDGYLCKETFFRETPSGKYIADIMLAVNRNYGKSDYIPCITWGRTAILTGGFNVGSRIRLVGRIQSRNYIKKTEKCPKGEERIAYEVSAIKLECTNEL